MYFRWSFAYCSKSSNRTYRSFLHCYSGRQWASWLLYFFLAYRLRSPHVHFVWCACTSLSSLLLWPKFYAPGKLVCNCDFQIFLGTPLPCLVPQVSGNVEVLGVELDRLVVLTKSRKYNTQVAIRLTLPGPVRPNSREMLRCLV